MLLDGDLSPERLDPFGSRDRKMVNYLLEDDDPREERTGYLYLEFKREDSPTYCTVGMASGPAGAAHWKNGISGSMTDGG